MVCQGYEPDEQGINNTHTALISYDNNAKPELSYVKFCPENEYQLLAEALCYLLANQLEIRQPIRAAIINIPVKRVLAAGVPVPQKYLNQDIAPAWCTQALGGKAIKAIYRLDPYMRTAMHTWYKRAPVAVSKIAAFDELVANRDRNMGNLIQLAPNTVAIIDHGLAIDPSILAMPNARVRNIVVEILAGKLNSAQIEAFKSQKVYASADHDQALRNCLADIRYWVTKFGIDERFSDNLCAFLTHRANRNWLANQLGMI